MQRLNGLQCGVCASRPLVRFVGRGLLGTTRLPVVLPRRFGGSTGFARRAILTAVWTANFALVGILIYGFFVSDVGYDWRIYREAGQRVMDGSLYIWRSDYAWSYSPLLAYVFAAIAPIGLIGWSVLHGAALLALGDRWLAAITLVSWPFWADLYNGNTMVFVFVVAAAALRRSQVGTGSYLALCLLMPRPVMLPLMIWILWKQPLWRVRFGALVLVNALLVLATGYGPAWLDALIRVPDAVAGTSRDIGPAVLLGPWWLVVGAILAVALTLRGKLGWASIAASPYWLPQYFLMLLLELVPSRSARHFVPFGIGTKSTSEPAVVPR